MCDLGQILRLRVIATGSLVSDSTAPEELGTSILNPEDRGSSSFRNLDNNLPDYKVSYNPEERYPQKQTLLQDIYRLSHKQYTKRFTGLSENMYKHEPREILLKTEECQGILLTEYKYIIRGTR
jgi:hypothetical protein